MEMEHVLLTINLTDHQKSVLVNVLSAATPHLAASETEGDEQVVAATEVLVDLDLLDITDEGEAELTELGKIIMADEGLSDELGELTEFGKTFQDETDAATEPPPEEPEGSFDEMLESKKGWGTLLTSVNNITIS